MSGWHESRFDRELSEARELNEACELSQACEGGQPCEAGQACEAKEACAGARSRFSEYLDGALDGRVMGELASHLEICTACSAEFTAWRSLQSILGELGPSAPPEDLQAQLRDALAGELRYGSYLSPFQQLAAFGRNTLAPLFVRAGAGLAAALVLLGTTTWFIGSVAPVQANDDRLANLHPPRFLYTAVPFQPITGPRPFVAVMVEAKVDARGRVYDYAILEGPDDPSTRARIEASLLASVFKPATVFGEPVRGHAMITYTVISVHG